MGRWTLGGLLRLVAACAVALGVLRSPLGEVAALAAGGVVGCGLAPYYACRGLRRIEAGPARFAPRDARPMMLAESYVLTWAAWFLAGVVVAAGGVAASRWLRP